MNFMHYKLCCLEFIYANKQELCRKKKLKKLERIFYEFLFDNDDNS